MTHVWCVLFLLYTLPGVSFVPLADWRQIPHKSHEFPITSRDFKTLTTIIY